VLWRGGAVTRSPRRSPPRGSTTECTNGGRGTKGCHVVIRRDARTPTDRQTHSPPPYFLAGTRHGSCGRGGNCDVTRCCCPDGRWRPVRRPTSRRFTRKQTGPPPLHAVAVEHIRGVRQPPLVCRPGRILFGACACPSCRRPRLARTTIIIPLVVRFLVSPIFRLFPRRML